VGVGVGVCVGGEVVMSAPFLLFFPCNHIINNNK
jgi:hypothetical protein